MKNFNRMTKLCSGLVLAGALAAAAHGAIADEFAAQNAGAPMVQITKNCPQLRYLGREATFEITVTNSGGGAAQNVVVTDRIMGNIQFMSADNDGQRQGNDIVWRLGTLPAGESRTLKANFRCNQVGTIKNAASVTYCGEAMDECEMEVKGVSAILIECVDAPDPIELNGEVTYTIVVTNQGTAIGTNIAITCTLPAEEEYVSSSGPTTGSASGKTITFAPLATLAPKAKATYTLTVKGVGTGDVRFKVEMKSDQMTSPVMETESTNIYN